MSATFIPHSAQAQNKKKVPLKIAMVSIAAVRANAIAGQKIQEQLLKIQEQINADLQIEEKSLRDANAQLSRKRTLLAPDAFSIERTKYEQRVAAYQSKRQESQKLLNSKMVKARSQLNRKIGEIITRYAEAHQITLVLPLSGAILAADAYNISDYVLAALNKELPTITITVPAK